MKPAPISLAARDAEQALDALLTRVRWYAVRPWTRVPAVTAAAFNALADALGKPHSDLWRRIV